MGKSERKGECVSKSEIRGKKVKAKADERANAKAHKKKQKLKQKNKQKH